MATPARGARTWGHPAFASGIAALSLLVFSCPVVADPPVPLRNAFAHLFGAWIVVVLVLGRISSALRRDREPSDGGRDG